MHENVVALGRIVSRGLARQPMLPDAVILPAVSLAGAPSIRVRASTRCSICGSAGDVLYEGLDDVLFGAPGTWTLRRCTDRGCGLLWLDPQPIEEDIGKAYATYFTHAEPPGAASLPKRIFRSVRASYLRSELGYERATSSKGWRWLAPLGHLHPGGGDAFAASAMFLPAPASGESLLDVGCGGGDFIASMRELGWKVSGVETDPIAAERARGRQLDVHQGDLESAAFDATSFDAITLAHVIEHVHEPKRLLMECRRILKPNGKLAITTPNSSSLGHRHFGKDWLALDPPRHIHLFNSSNMRRLLESAGLDPVRVATLAINASAIWPASEAIRRSRSSPAGAGDTVGLKTTLPGVARAVAERLRLSVDPSAGEDLLAAATRTA
jgi:2-polyprenyl-3-methyl-5-hydroxy-6-metoxy-1,4-benzoquinol methylase